MKAQSLIVVGALALGLVLSAPLAAKDDFGVVQPAANVMLEASSGQTTLALNDHYLREMGVKLSGEIGERDIHGFLPVHGTFAGLLQFTPEGAGISEFSKADANARWPVSLVRRDGAKITLQNLTLVPGNWAGGGDSLLRAIDADGDPLLDFSLVHHKLHGAVRVELMNGDIRIAPKLAQWIGLPEVTEATIGQFSLSASIRAPLGFSAAPKSCNFVYWPGSTKPAGPALVKTLLIRLGDSAGGSLAAACAGSCTGASAARVVKITPGATIANSTDSDAAHVPWYPMFSSANRPGWPPVNPPPVSGQPNYPYATLDAHPMLIWSVYRINADNQIEQIGRSGVKHAFLTINRNCLPGCNVNGNILGPGCDDIYSIGNNDSNGFLGVRSEIDPLGGMHGRCQSTFDTNCDGATGPGVVGAANNFDRRLMVVERDLAPGLNPSARWFLESWYIVRDQVNPLTAMGSQQFTPAFGTVWTVPVVTSGAGAFRQGAAIDRWVDPANPGANAASTHVKSDNGSFKVAVRATPVGARWRYDYAVFNIDYARRIVPISGQGSAEPNLCLASNSGFGSFSVPVSSVDNIANLSHFDNGAPASNDWAGSAGANAVNWSAPAGGTVTRCGLSFAQPDNTLDFGTLFRFSFESDAAPRAGRVTLTEATGAAAAVTASVLVPANLDVLLEESFE